MRPRQAPAAAAKGGEFRRVVRAGEPDFVAVTLHEYAQPLAVGEARRPVRVDERLERPQRERRLAAFRRNLGVVEIGVPAMEEPAVLGPDGDAAMTSRMAGQGHQEHVVAPARQRAHAVKSEPFVPAGLDKRPVRYGGELRRKVAHALSQGRVLRRAQFGPERVHGRRREIAKAARVVEIEMSRHDVTHVGHAEAEVGDLPQRRLGDPEPRPGRRPEQAPEPLRIRDVLDPEPAVNQDQSVLALEQQAMAAHRAADEPRAEGTHRPAIQMVNSHSPAFIARVRRQA